MRSVGDELLLLPPGLLYRPDRAARQQHCEAEERKQAECTEQHAVFHKRAQCLLLAGNVREDHAAGHAAVAQAVFRDLADGVLRGLRRSCGHPQKRPVGQIVITRPDGDQIAERIGLQHEIRQAHLLRLTLRLDRREGIGRDGLHHADRLGAQVPLRQRIEKPDNRAEHDSGDEHDRKNDLQTQFFQHVSSTSR